MKIEQFCKEFFFKLHIKPSLDTNIRVIGLTYSFLLYFIVVVLVLQYLAVPISLPDAKVELFDLKFNDNLFREK